MAKGDLIKGQSEPSDFDIGNGRAVAVVNVDPATGLPRLPVKSVALVNRSGTIAVGSSAQQFAAANPSRQVLRFQNQSNATLWVRDDGAAATMDHNSIQVLSGALYEPVAISSLMLSVIGATTGQAFSAQEG